MFLRSLLEAAAKRLYSLQLYLKKVRGSVLRLTGTRRRMRDCLAAAFCKTGSLRPAKEADEERPLTVPHKTASLDMSWGRSGGIL